MQACSHRRTGTHHPSVKRGSDSIEWEKILASYKFDQALVKHTKDKERKKINIKKKKNTKNRPRN